MRFMDFYTKVILTESVADVKNMLAPVFSVIYAGDDPNYPTYEKNELSNALRSIQNHASMVTDRGDFLLWTARWYRLWVTADYAFYRLGDLDKELLQKMFRKYCNDFRKHGVVLDDQEFRVIATTMFDRGSGHMWEQLKTSIRDYIDPKSHSFVFSASQIRFAYQTPDQIIHEIEDTVNATVAGNKRFIPQDALEPKAVKYLDFGNGLAWWLLNTHSCGAEANAMGHCGNQHADAPWDNILSFRKEVVAKNGQPGFIPYLTFIIDEGGLLGEMKGRYNTKPSPDFYRYIIPLLKSDIVKGIGFAGLEAEGNFTLNDLPEKVREELLAEKPELRPIDQRILDNAAENPEVSTRLVSNVFNNLDLPPVKAVIDKEGIPTIIFGTKSISDTAQTIINEYSDNFEDNYDDLAVIYAIADPYSIEIDRDNLADGIREIDISQTTSCGNKDIDKKLKELLGANPYDRIEDDFKDEFSGAFGTAVEENFNPSSVNWEKFATFASVFAMYGAGDVVTVRKDDNDTGYIAHMRADNLGKLVYNIRRNPEGAIHFYRDDYDYDYDDDDSPYAYSDADKEHWREEPHEVDDLGWLENTVRRVFEEQDWMAMSSEDDIDTSQLINIYDTSPQELSGIFFLSPNTAYDGGLQSWFYEGNAIIENIYKAYPNIIVETFNYFFEELEEMDIEPNLDDEDDEA